MDTRVNRIKDMSRYETNGVEDISLLVSKELAQYTRHLRLDLRRFLFFSRYLRADAELWDGAHVAKGFPQTGD